MHVYFGCYGPSVFRSDYNADTGALSKPVAAGDCENGSFLAVHPSKPVLYAATEAGDSGGVAAFAIDPDSGMLKPLGVQSAHGGGTCFVSVSPDGNVVLAANYGGGSVAAFAVQPDGSLAPAAFTHQHEGSGPNPRRQDGPHAHCFVPSPDGRFALSCDLGTDEVFVYRMAADAALTLHEPATFTLAPGAGPRHLAFSPDGQFLHVLGELDSKLYVFAWDAAAGTAELIQTLPTLPGDFETANTAAEVAVHPSGKFVYASNRGHDSIAIFARDVTTGRLTVSGHRGSGGEGPRHFAITPDGQRLLAANQKSNNVVVFDLCAETGELSRTEHGVQLDKPVCVRFVG